MNDSTNGKPAAKQELQKPMKSTRLATMEAGIRAYHETAQEIDDLKDTIAHNEAELKAKQLEIDSLNGRIETMRDDHASAITTLESRVHECEAQRDRAVAEKVALDTIIASMRQVLKLAPERDDAA